MSVSETQEFDPSGVIPELNVFLGGWRRPVAVAGSAGGG